MQHGIMMRPEYVPSSFPLYLLLLLSLFLLTSALSQRALVDGYHVDACVRVPTGLVDVPTWLHLRSRLTAVVFGDKPLVALEVAVLKPLARWPASQHCSLGALAVRLALAVRELELLPRLARSSANLSSVAADWGLARTKGFSRVIHSGWPVFPLFRRLQSLMADAKPGLSDCDKLISPAQWAWIRAYPSHEGDFPWNRAGNYIDLFPMDSDGLLSPVAAAVWPLLMATHYLVAAANIYTKPGMAAKFVDDLRDEIKTASMDDPLSEVFLKKSIRYLHNFFSTLESQWPVLAILSQLTADRKSVV